jgi:hypothetical protein
MINRMYHEDLKCMVDPSFNCSSQLIDAVSRMYSWGLRYNQDLKYIG